MTPIEENPLEGRTCAERICVYPSECIGTQCSKFELCCFEILRARVEIDRLKKHHIVHGGFKR